MTAAREGPRAAVRFAGTAAATAVILTTVFAPALIGQPGALLGWLALTGRSRTPEMLARFTIKGASPGRRSGSC
jgi:hypothetical protein